MLCSFRVRPGLCVARMFGKRIVELICNDCYQNAKQNWKPEHGRERETHDICIYLCIYIYIYLYIYICKYICTPTPGPCPWDPPIGPQPPPIAPRPPAPYQLVCGQGSSAVKARQRSRIVSGQGSSAVKVRQARVLEYCWATPGVSYSKSHLTCHNSHLTSLPRPVALVAQVRQ